MKEFFYLSRWYELYFLQKPTCYGNQHKPSPKAPLQMLAERAILPPRQTHIVNVNWAIMTAQAWTNRRKPYRWSVNKGTMMIQETKGNYCYRLFLSWSLVYGCLRRPSPSATMSAEVELRVTELSWNGWQRSSASGCRALRGTSSSKSWSELSMYCGGASMDILSGGNMSKLNGAPPDLGKNEPLNWGAIATDLQTFLAILMVPSACSQAKTNQKASPHYSQ